MPVIYSTLSSGVDVNIFDPKAKAPNPAKQTITINGGAGVQNKRNFETPRGVATVVSADQLKALQAHPWFKTQVDAGYLAVDEKETSKPSEEEIEEKVEEEMAERDAGAQDTAEDYKKRGAKAPKTDKE